jgi:enoyl-CoA hydratase
MVVSVSASDQSVESEVANGVGRLVLNRPESLNALDLSMIRALRAALEAWRDDAAVHSVVIESSSARAFCAGGDIVAVRADVLAGSGAAADTFFDEEYALNLAIAEYPKPFVALIDGYCMGGGLGVSVHGSHRVVTERARLAMPEMVIGFICDVGASYFLPRLPEPIGRYLALTGAPLGGADSVSVGLATHFVPSGELADVRTALLRGDSPDVVLAGYDWAPAGTLDEHRDELEACFVADDLDEVVDRLADIGGDWAEATRSSLTSVSALSLAVTDELLRAGADSDLDACLRRELAVATFVIRRPDFAEGVRSRLVDRDNSPAWISGPALAADLAGALGALRSA